MNSTLAHRKAEVRLEDDALVRGAGSFVDDRRLPNQAAAVFVRSPHASARIVSIDTGKAREARKAWSRCSPPTTSRPPASRAPAAIRRSPAAAARS